MAFTRDGRDFYKTPDGQLVSVEQGFDVSTAYQGLTPASKEDVDARDNERATAPLQQDPRFDRDEQGYVNPDAAFGDVAPATAEQVAEFQTAEPEKPPEAKPFSRDGRDYYRRPDGSIVSVDAGFDTTEDYPNLVPATAEEVRKRDIQKRSGNLIDQVETAGHTAAASVVEAAAGVANFGHDMVDFFGAHEPIRGRDLVPNVGGEPLFYGKKELEQREANPTAAILGSAVPDYLIARYLPAGRAAEAAMAAEAARAASGAKKVFSLIGPETTAARTLASSVMTEAGNAVIERDEFDLGRAFGVWAPTQLVFEGGLNVGAHALGRAFGAGKNAVNTLVERARTSAVDRALRETDPVKAAELLRKEAPAIYERAQATLDDALDAIDARLESSPDRLFTPGELRKTVSDNASAQADAMAPIMARLRQAAEVVDSPVAAEAFDALNKVRGWGGPAQYRAARDAWKVLVESGLDNPLIVEAREALAQTLADENVWGKAARYHANAVAEANRVAGPVTQRSISDLASRAGIEQRLEQARAMARATGDKQLAANVEKAAAALAEADKATGARHLAGDLTNDEIAAMRKTLDAFPDQAPKLGERMTSALDRLEEIAPEAFPETWTAERVERHIAERVAGSKEARKQLDEVIQGAEGWLKRAKASESASPAVIARATAEIERLRALADELDDVSKARKAVSDYDARPRGRAERLIDAATGKLASKAASKIGSTVAGAAAGYAQGGPIGAAIGGLAAQAVEGAVEPIVRERATKLGKWLKDTLRKHKGTAAGVAALYGANRLANDPNDPSPNAAAAVALPGLTFLLSGKFKLKPDDMPGAARGLLSVAADSLEHRIAPGMTADATARHVDELLDAWTHNFNRNVGRAPNARETANARDVLARRAIERVEPRSAAVDFEGGASLDRMRQAINDSSVLLAENEMPITVDAVYNEARLRKEFTPAEAVRMREMIADSIGDLQASAPRLAERARAQRQQAAAAQNLPAVVRDKDVTAASERMRNATRALTNDEAFANDTAEAVQRQSLERVRPGMSQRQLRESIVDARSAYRTGFERELGRAPNAAELEYAEAMFELSALAHLRELNNNAAREAARVAAERAAPPPQTPFAQRRAAYLETNAVDLDDAVDRALGDLRRAHGADGAHVWLRQTLEEIPSRDVLVNHIQNGTSYGTPTSPEEVLRSQMALVRAQHVRAQAQIEGVRAPVPGTPEYGRMARLSPEMQAYAEARLQRSNREWAEQLQPPAPARPPLSELDGAARNRRLQDRFDFGRRLMQEVPESEAQELGRFFRNDEAPTVADVDAVIARIREQRPVTPAQEVWLRDQLGQQVPSWRGMMDQAAEELGAQYRGDPDDIERIGVEEVLEWLEENGQELTTLDEWSIRREFDVRGRRYVDRYEERAREAAEEAAGDAGVEFDGIGLPDRDTLSDLGIYLDVQSRDGIARVFKQELDETDLRELFGLDQLQAYADEIHEQLSAELHVGHNEVTFKGRVGGMEISRTYTPRENGFNVYNNLFVMPAEKQGSGAKGLGKQVLRGQANRLEKLGAKTMSLNAAWVGRYIWPKLGFRPSPVVEKEAIDAFSMRLARWMGLQPADALEAAGAKLDNIRDLADTRIRLDALDETEGMRDNLVDFWEQTKRSAGDSLDDIPFEQAFVRKGKDGKPDEFLAGKFFLLNVHGGWNNGLRIDIDPESPWWNEYKSRVGASAAFLGFGMSELIKALNQDPQSVWTEPSPWAEDADRAREIIDSARQEADAVDEEREQTLDETRDKLGFLSHQGQQLLSTTARQLASPSREDRVAQRLPGVTNSAGVAQFLGNQKTMAAAYQEKRANLQRLQKDPMALVNEMTESLGELQQTAPELHAQVVQQTYKVAQYLFSKIPTTIGVDLTRPEGSPPNEYAVRQFALYYSAATDPSSVLTDLANNRARKEQVDTLRDVWPDTYTSLKVAVVEHLSRGKPTVNQRIRLNSLFDFGPNLDRALSPGLVAVLDGYRAKQGQQGAEKAAPERRTQPSIVGSSATPQLELGAMGAPRAGLA